MARIEKHIEHGGAPRYTGAFDSTGLTRSCLIKHEGYGYPVFESWVRECGHCAGIIMSYLTAEYWNSGRRIIERSTDEIVSGLVNFYESKTVRQNLKALHAAGWLETPSRSPEDARDITVKLRGSSTSKGYLQCSWCNARCYALQAHHFPVPLRDAGELTVDICRDCHVTYHHVKDYRLHALTQKTRIAFNSMDWVPESLWKRFCDLIHIDDGDAYGRYEDHA